MRYRFLLIISIVLIWILFVGYNNGPAQIAGIDRTGSPLANGAFCGECHSDGAFSPEMVIDLLNSDGQSVTKYTPGETYHLRIDLNTTGTPAGYGVQAVAIDLDKNNAGEFRNGSQRTQFVEVSGVTFFEHEKLGSILPYETEWVAPPKGTGLVVIYSGAIAANGNRGNAGDGATLGKVDVEEDLSSGTNDFNEENLDFQLLTNPVSQKLKVIFKDHLQGEYNFQLFNVAGSTLLKNKQSVAFNQIVEIDITNLEKGIYFLQIFDAEKRTTKKVIKI